MNVTKYIPPKYIGAAIGATLGAINNARKSKKRGENKVQGFLNALRGAAGGAIGGYAVQTAGAAIKDGTALQQLKDVKSNLGHIRDEFNRTAPKGTGNIFQRVLKYYKDPDVNKRMSQARNRFDEITRDFRSGALGQSEAKNQLDEAYLSRMHTAPRATLGHHVMKPVGGLLGTALALNLARGQIDRSPTRRGRDADDDDEG